MIYLDNNATTPIDKEALEAISRAPFGNASSQHQFGKQAAAALREATVSVAHLLGAKESDSDFYFRGN